MRQSIEPQHVEVIAEEAARQRDRPVEFVGKLDELGAAILFGLTAEREIVGLLAEQIADRLVESRSVRQLVLSDRRKGNVFCQDGGKAGPVGVAVAEHELIVGDAQEKIGEWLFEFWL